MTIHVTAQDIAEGKRFECRDCPIALAAKRALLGAKDVAAGAILLSV